MCIRRMAKARICKPDRPLPAMKMRGDCKIACTSAVTLCGSTERNARSNSASTVVIVVSNSVIGTYPIMDDLGNLRRLRSFRNGAADHDNRRTQFQHRVERVQVDATCDGQRRIRPRRADLPE